jgi:hypothetical protein
VDASGNTPVQLYMFGTVLRPIADHNQTCDRSFTGYDFVFDSHPDIYIMDFSEYVSSISNTSVFDKPAICQTNTAENPGVCAS